MPLVADTELEMYQRITKLFPRHTSQLNKVNQADSELVRLPGAAGVMAITTDMICEEIEYGIYDDPYMMGWMTIAINISDLCAVGAKPLYIMLHEIFLHDSTEYFINRVQQGIADACRAFNVFVLGGDTNFSNKITLGATAIGFIQNEKMPLSRMGCKDGDILFSSGPLGLGNFLGFCKLNKIDFDFKPLPKIRYSEIISKYASACIDTSDGMFNALHILTTLNNVGAALDQSLYEVIPKQISLTCERMGVSPITLLAGILGEYELLFTIPKHNLNAFMDEVKSVNLTAHKLGLITIETTVSYQTNSGMQNIDTHRIANLFSESKGNFFTYINSLKEIFKLSDHE